MAEYTYEDIIIDPYSEEAKNAIGKEVYYTNWPMDLLKFAIKDKGKGILTIASGLGFLVNDTFWQCIIVKKEEPKPKYVPFETLDEFIESYKKSEERITYSNTRDYIASCGMWLRFNNDDVLCAVTEIWTDGVFLGHDHMKIKWEELFNFYTFMDDTPCGKEVEDE